MNYIKNIMRCCLYIVSFFVLVFFLSDVLFCDYALFFDEGQYKPYYFSLAPGSYFNLEESFQKLYVTDKISGVFFFDLSEYTFGHFIDSLYSQMDFTLSLFGYIKYKILCSLFIFLHKSFFNYYNAFELLCFEQYILNCFFINIFFKCFIGICDLNTFGCDLLKCKQQMLYNITKEQYSTFNVFPIEGLSTDYIHDSSFGPCEDEDLEFNLPFIDSFRSSLYSYLKLESITYSLYLPYFEEFFFLADFKETYGIHSSGFLFKHLLFFSSILRVEAVNYMDLVLKNLGEFNVFYYNILHINGKKDGSYFLDSIIYFHQNPLSGFNSFFKYYNNFSDLDYYYFLSLYDQGTKVTDEGSLTAGNIIFSNYPELKEDFIKLTLFENKNFFLEKCDQLDIYQIYQQLYDDPNFYFFSFLIVCVIIIYLVFFFSKTLYVIYIIFFFNHKTKDVDSIKNNTINSIQRYYFIRHSLTLLFYLLTFIENLFYNIYCPNILLKTIYRTMRYCVIKIQVFVEYQMSGILQTSGILQIKKVRINNMQQVLLNQIERLDDCYFNDLLTCYVDTIFDFDYKNKSTDLLCPLILRRLDKIRLKYANQKRRLKNDLNKLL